MLKKIGLFSVIPIAILSTTTVFAAGKLNVPQENFIVTDLYNVYGYAYAKVENIGDKPMVVNAGLLEIFDTAGDTITSEDYMAAYAKNLQPGEYTYVKMYSRIEDVEASDVDDYLLTITGKSEAQLLSAHKYQMNL